MITLKTSRCYLVNQGSQSVNKGNQEGKPGKNIVKAINWTKNLIYAK